MIVGGSVLGMGMGDTPDQVAGRLGAGFYDDKTRLSMRRDYGLVEFFWNRQCVTGPWLSAGFTVQVHRLATDRSLAAGPWGRLGPRVRFADLRADLARLGFSCTEITAEADRPDWRRFWHEEALISILVTRTPWGRLTRPGDVFAIQCPHSQAAVAGDKMRAHWRTMRDGLEHLLRLDDSGRRAWLDRSQPGPADRVNWWLYLMVVIDGRLRDQPASRPGWIDLRVWLMREAVARGVFTPVRYAGDMAYFALTMRRAGATSPSLPPADDVVRGCLEAIPVPPEQAVGRDDDGNLLTFDRAVLTPSRQARNLVNAAQWHLDALTDQELASRLTDWMVIRHLLV